MEENGDAGGYLTRIEAIERKMKRVELLTMPWSGQGTKTCVVNELERALVERFGKFNRYWKPGLHFTIPLVEKTVYVNITEQMVDAKKQEIITKDNLNATVDAQIYFKVLERSNIPRGGVLLETNAGQLDARLEEQMGAFVASLQPGWEEPETDDD